MSPASEPIFPPEIFSCIIDELFDDKKTLMDCSLVCRAWVPGCRYHLFSEVMLCPDTWWQASQCLDVLDLYACAALVTCHRHQKEWKTLTSDLIFCPLLRYFLSKIPRWVRILLPGLDNLKLLAVSSKIRFKDDMKQLTFPNITFLVVKCRETLGPIWHPGQHYPLLQCLPTVFPRITTVDFADLFDTFYETVEFICSFRELENLVIRFRTLHALDGDIEPFRLPVGLRTVAIQSKSRYSEEINFVDWLSRTEPTPQFTTLTFLYFDSDHLGTIAKLVRRTGKYLRLLRLLTHPCLSISIFFF